MLTPRKFSAVLSRARGPQTPAPSPCTPSPAPRGILSERKDTGYRCTLFQDHPVLETPHHFRIIRGLEYAPALSVNMQNSFGSMVVSTCS